MLSSTLLSSSCFTKGKCEPAVNLQHSLPYAAHGCVIVSCRRCTSAASFARFDADGSTSLSSPSLHNWCCYFLVTNLVDVSDFTTRIWVRFTIAPCLFLSHSLGVLFAFSVRHFKQVYGGIPHLMQKHKHSWGYIYHTAEFAILLLAHGPTFHLLWLQNH